MLKLLKKIFGLAKSEDTLTKVLNDDPLLVDVRTPAEFSSGHVSGSINVPLGQLHTQMSKFEGQPNIVVFCQSGMRSAQAKSILQKAGFENVTNAGSWRDVVAAMKSNQN